MALRSLLFVAFSLAAIAAELVHPELPEVKRVYLLPMSSGLDQYLANQLTKAGRFEVVTDPAKADAVFTDRIGTAFEDRWNELYPPPAPPPKPVDPKADKDSKADTLDTAAPPMVRVSSFGRGRGNVFLVSRKTNSVIWSHFTAPKNMGSKTLDRTAGRIVDQLRDDLNPKK